MVRFQLNHSCSKPGCEGSRGDVITISEDDARFLSDNRGGRVLPDLAIKAETATANPVTETRSRSRKGDT